MNTKQTKTHYTKASISGDTLFWLFGVELGIIDASIHSMEDLEAEVDRLYTKQEIQEMSYTIIHD